MMRTRLSKLAQEAKKVKLAAAPAPSGQGTGPTGGPGKTKPSTQYRILESPGCRRVALVGDKGRVDARAAESLMWKLQSWETNYLLQAIILQGRPGKEFSAGWMRPDGSGAEKEKQAAFRRHSQLSYLLATLRKPTIAWYNGDVLGGGMGLGLARYRVSTERSNFQVVGPKHGWVLDGGLSYLLPRLRATDGAMGGTGSLAFARYLALTGASLSGLDMLAAGLSTHHMEDSMAGNLHKRLADLTYEPDFMVEDVLSEHAAMFYKLDTQLNPPPYQELFDEWPKNDEARERDMKRSSGVSTGYDDGPGWADEEEEEEGWVHVDDPAMLSSKEEAKMEAATAEEGGENSDLRLVLGKLDPLTKAFVACNEPLLEEDGFGPGGKKSNKAGAPSPDTEGSLWWHRNFAESDEAFFKAHWETIDASIQEQAQDKDLGTLAAIYEKFADNLPEYVTYPERKRLVDADRLLLSPWNCSVDRAERFPEFMELAAKVETCFQGGSLEEVVEGLRADNSAWAQECLRRMDGMSPLSLKLVFQQLEQAKDLDIEDAFRMDYRVGRRLLSSAPSITAAGVEALKAVSADQVASFFQPFASGEEELDLPEKEKVEHELQPGQRFADVELQRRFLATTTTRASI